MCLSTNLSTTTAKEPGHLGYAQELVFITIQCHAVEDRQLIFGHI